MSDTRQNLITAAERVLAGLNARIERNAKSRLPAPVFEGIAELHAAVQVAKAADLVCTPAERPQ